MPFLYLMLCTAHGQTPPAVPSPDAEALATQARHIQQRAVLELSGGVALMAGGIAVMSVGRGPSGDISTETQATSDIRSMGGAGMLLSGFLIALVGGDTLGNAVAKRNAAEQALQVAVMPNGIVVAARF